jgi:hypothetical protein
MRTAVIANKKGNQLEEDHPVSARQQLETRREMRVARLYWG